MNFLAHTYEFTFSESVPLHLSGCPAAPSVVLWSLMLLFSSLFMTNGSSPLLALRVYLQLFQGLSGVATKLTWPLPIWFYCLWGFGQFISDNLIQGYTQPFFLSSNYNELFLHPFIILPKFPKLSSRKCAVQSIEGLRLWDRGTTQHEVIRWQQPTPWHGALATFHPKHSLCIHILLVTLGISFLKASFQLPPFLWILSLFPVACEIKILLHFNMLYQETNLSYFITTPPDTAGGQRVDPMLSSESIKVFLQTIKPLNPWT